MDKKKKIKIAIATHKMVMGGIEKSLIELIKTLNNNNCEITVFVESSGGALYDDLCAIAHVIDIFGNYKNAFGIIKQKIQQKQVKKACAVLYSYFLNRFNGDPVRSWKITAMYLDKPAEIYDYAFAYGAPVSFSVIFVDKLICSKKKYTWIHNDVSQISLSVQKYREVFLNYDKLICVSKKTLKSFLDLLPEYCEKSMVFYNLLDQSEILNKSQHEVELKFFSGIKLLTVGRICYEKGQDVIPSIVKRLIGNGYNVKWYCVGDGEERNQLEKQIKDYKVESRVILLGNQNNPYPFFKMADIYIQPSRHEGFGITISEAKIFKLPIITTDFDGADEQIVDGETGFIVPFDMDLIYQKIVALLEDSKIRDCFSKNLENDSKSCVSSLNDLLN